MKCKCLVLLLSSALLLGGCAPANVEAAIAFPETDGTLLEPAEQDLTFEDKNVGHGDDLKIISHGDMDPSWKDRLGDMDITNEWLGNDCIVICGSLKSDPQQGIAKVMFLDPDEKQIDVTTQFHTPRGTGAVTVTRLGAKDYIMDVEDEQGNSYVFNVYNGFTQREET